MTAVTEQVKVVSFELLYSFKEWCGEECIADLVVLKPRNRGLWKKRNIRSNLNNMK